MQNRVISQVRQYLCHADVFSKNARKKGAKLRSPTTLWQTKIAMEQEIYLQSGPFYIAMVVYRSVTAKGC